MNNLKIPKSIELMGTKISVEFDKTLSYRDDCVGLASYRQSKIFLQPRSDSVDQTDDHVMHAFFHELMHHILYMVGDDGIDPPLHKREYLVDRISGLFHQAMKSAVYDEDECVECVGTLSELIGGNE
jgi:hypothetical protein